MFGRDRADFRITYGPVARGHGRYSDLLTDWMVPACAPAFLAGHPVVEPADVLGRALLRIDWDLGAKALPGWHDWARLIGGRRAGKRRATDLAWIGTITRRQARSSKPAGPPGTEPVRR